MFPKMCLFKIEKLGKSKNIQHKFFKNYDGIELKEWEAPEREGYVEIQGPVSAPREFFFWVSTAATDPGGFWQSKNQCEKRTKQSA